ncbi:hypothetical protein AAC387_Pa08g2163 [Persea americana]
MPRKVVSDVLDSSPQQMAGNEKDRDLPCLLPFQLKEALHRRLLSLTFGATSFHPGKVTKKLVVNSASKPWRNRTLSCPAPFDCACCNSDILKCSEAVFHSSKHYTILYYMQ